LKNVKLFPTTTVFVFVQRAKESNFKINPLDIKEEKVEGGSFDNRTVGAFFFFFLLLFICAYKAWVISPPGPPGRP
jgi:hypothetical protein